MFLLLCVFSPRVEFAQAVDADRRLAPSRQAAPLAVGLKHLLKHHLAERPEIVVDVEINPILSSKLFVRPRHGSRPFELSQHFGPRFLKTGRVVFGIGPQSA